MPGFWRPIVGIDAFDLRQHEIDVTPWLPLLCDGASHTFEIRVAGLNDDGAGHATLSEVVGSYWVVTGTIFLFLGPDGSVTTGTSPSIDTPLPEIEISSSITTNSTGANDTLEYTTAVSRDIVITSTVKSSSGTRKASWTQSLSYTNFNSVRILWSKNFLFAVNRGHLPRFESRKSLHSPESSYYLGEKPYCGSKMISMFPKFVSFFGLSPQMSNADFEVCIVDRHGFRAANYSEYYRL